MISALTRAFALLLACASAAALGYDYPIADRYAATIIGTPAEYAAKLPTQIPVRSYRLDPLGEVPGQFWYQEGLEFSAALQKGAAPLVFLVAGTGAAHDSDKMVALQKALYDAGFHVVNLGSPTQFNFIVNASRTSLPGYLPDDTADLYRVMEQAWGRLRGDGVEASEFLVAGYSLGGIAAAFLAAHDERERTFGFRRALMINPPVDLYSSVKLLDGYLSDNLRHGQGGDFLDAVIERLARAYDPARGFRIDEDFLFRAYEMTRGQGGIATLDGVDAEEALIGMSFRLSSSAMVFVGDVMAKAGYIAPAGKSFGRAESLEYYAWASSSVAFAEYVDELLIPTLMRLHPGSTRESLLAQTSLRALEEYVRTSGKVWAQTNADEIILAPGELDWLRQALGPRIRVYPRGGHCGNITHRDNVRDTVAILRGEPLPAGV